MNDKIAFDFEKILKKPSMTSVICPECRTEHIGQNCIPEKCEKCGKVFDK